MEVKSCFSDCDHLLVAGEFFELCHGFVGDGFCVVGVYGDGGVEVVVFFGQFDCFSGVFKCCTDGDAGRHCCFAASPEDLFDLVGEWVEGQMAVCINQFHRLSHEGVFVVGNSGTACVAEDDGDDVESVWAVFDLVGGEEITGCSGEFAHFVGGDDGFGGCEILTCSGFYFDEDDGAVRGHHDEVDFACLAGKVAGEGLEASAFEEFFAASFAPSAEVFWVGEELSFV